MKLEINKIQSLMGDGTSKINKIWLAVTWQANGYEFEWKWDRFRDPVKFKFTDAWLSSKCYDDVYQAMD
jgi:hypothetical protein